MSQSRKDGAPSFPMVEQHRNGRAIIHPRRREDVPMSEQSDFGLMALMSHDIVDGRAVSESVRNSARSEWLRRFPESLPRSGFKSWARVIDGKIRRGESLR